MKYRFTLILPVAVEMTEELANSLYAAGCDDGSPGSCGGILSIDFHREAATLVEAIRSAVRDVRSAGLDVDHVELTPEEVGV